MISFKMVNGDWAVNGSGRIERISGSKLLLQHICKILDTDKENTINQGSIRFRYNPTYGTLLSFLRNVVPILTVEDARQAVQTEVRQVITKYAEIQNDKIPLGLTPEETLVDATVLATIEGATPEDNRVRIKYELELINASGTSQKLNQEGLSLTGA